MTIDITITLSHVYGLNDRFGGELKLAGLREPVVRTGFPTPADRIEFVVGEVPGPVLERRRLGIAQMTAMLTGFRVPSATDDRDPDRAILERLQEVHPDERLEGGRGSWATVSISRTLSDSGHLVVNDQNFAWLDSTFWVTFPEEFEEEVESLLEVAAASLLDALPGGYERVHRSRVAFETSGRGAVLGMRPQIGGPSISQELDPASFPSGELRDRLLHLRRPADWETRVVHWVTAVADESDPWKRFLWAMTGLEVLADRVARAHQERLLELVQVESVPGGAAKAVVTELLWPANSERHRRDDRSAVYRFAVMCVTLAPEAAAEDLAKFKELWRARGSVAHGGGDRDHPPPGWAAVAMLRKYTALWLRTT